MVGAAKRRADRETAECAQSEPSVSSESTQRTLQDISGLDGARDPVYVRRVPEEYSKITDLKNISEALGIGGWYVARGVSTNDLFPFLLFFLPSVPVLALSMGHANNCSSL